MDSFGKKMLAGVVTYIICGFLSYGWVYNHTPMCDIDIKDFCPSILHDGTAFFAGLIWPAYWTAKIAIYVTGKF